MQATSNQNQGTGHEATTSSQNTQHAVMQDLRHITSNTDLLTPGSTASTKERRPSKLSTTTPPRMSAKGTSSIPSSPSSIHSSTSAIFERDIEPLPSSLRNTMSPTQNPNTSAVSESHHHLNPHVLENGVPAVLSSAVEALSKDSDDHIAIISPASHTQSRPSMRPSEAPSSFGGSSHMASRSPSPTRRSFSVSVPGSPSASIAGQTGLHHPTAQPPTIAMSALSLSQPTSASVSPSLSPTSRTTTLPELSHSPPPTQNQLQVKEKDKRLSFVSYSDLLSSTPLSSVPLSSMLSPNSDAPPPHIPAVLGVAAGAGGKELADDEHLGGVGIDVGGEWEREGFGRGLEARLEEYLERESQKTSAVNLGTVST